MFVSFYFLLHVSVIHFDHHQSEKHRYRRKRATEGTSLQTEICSKYVRYYSHKKNKKLTIKPRKSIEFFSIDIALKSKI